MNDVKIRIGLKKECFQRLGEHQICIMRLSTLLILKSVICTFIKIMDTVRDLHIIKFSPIFRLEVFETLNLCLMRCVTSRPHS